VALIDTVKIGKLGGESTLRRHGVEHYQRMGQRSGDVRHARKVAEELEKQKAKEKAEGE
jgi:hypothetical protein